MRLRPMLLILVFLALVGAAESGGEVPDGPSEANQDPATAAVFAFFMTGPMAEVMERPGVELTGADRETLMANVASSLAVVDEAGDSWEARRARRYLQRAEVACREQPLERLPRALLEIFSSFAWVTEEDPQRFTRGRLDAWCADVGVSMPADAEVLGYAEAGLLENWWQRLKVAIPAADLDQLTGGETGPPLPADAYKPNEDWWDPHRDRAKHRRFQKDRQEPVPERAEVVVIWRLEGERAVVHVLSFNAE